ncbi:MAG TPA: hypothetical protein PLC52_04685 [Anaerolineales bacterium]|nr:hypothetical protein [Anaerolineales bacterium]HRQ92145.1 hypothetical protein [Anaerolineales bacterium]
MKPAWFALLLCLLMACGLPGVIDEAAQQDYDNNDCFNHGQDCPDLANSIFFGAAACRG